MGRLDRATLLKRRDMATVRFYADSCMAYIVRPRVGVDRRVPSVPHDEIDNQRIAASRNRRNMILMVRSNRPTCFVTLTFAEPTEPKDATNAWNSLAGKWRRRFKGFYVRVGEVSAEKNLHFHVLCSKSVAEFLSANWIHGFVDIRTVSFRDLEKICNYMSKDFSNLNRPFQRRYVASKGSKPNFDEMHFDTIDDALEGVAELSPLPLAALNVSVLQTNFGAYGVVKWNPNTDT